MITQLDDEQFSRLRHAITLARECLAIAAEVDDDLAVFHLKHALQSLHYTSGLASEGHEERETVTLTVYEASEPKTVKIRRHRGSGCDDA